MKKDQLIKRIAYLESINDLLETEIADIDRLMRLVGFSDGIETVKATAEEIIRMEDEQEQEGEDEAA